MAIIRFNPFFRPSFFRPLINDETDEWPEYAMTDGLDVYEQDNQVVVKAAVPGISEDKINITYEDGVLHISGQEEEKEEEKKKNKVVHKMQRVTAFDYTTTVPRAIDPTKIEASVENGVLIIKAPMAESAKPRKIPVKTVSKK